MIKSYMTLKEFLKDPLEFISQVSKNQGPVAHMTFFGKHLYLVSSPEDVTQVLKTDNQIFIRGKALKEMQKFLGKGLITNDGDEWRKQHILIRPTMAAKNVIKLAWRIVLRALFSQPSNDEMDDWLTDILEMISIVTSKIRSPLKIPLWMPTRKNRRFKSILKKFDNYVFELISSRRSGERKEDFLQFLLDAHEEGVEGMTDQKLRDEVLTFLMAGHETVTNTMTWALIELGKNKDYIELLQQEAKAFECTKDFDQLLSAPYLGAVIDEAMRLWPPVWVTRREVSKETVVNGKSIPKGATVLISPYLSHRNPVVWIDPEKFRPERFLPEEKKKMVSGQFYTYGLGPRACIGMHLANLELRIILATIVSRYDWSILNPGPQECVAEITLRPKNNLHLQFRRRDAVR